MTAEDTVDGAKPVDRVVVKIGSTSVTAPDGSIDTAAIGRLCDEVAGLRESGLGVVVVTSGAISSGWCAMGRGPRPTDLATLQAVAAVGQHLLMRVYGEALGARGHMRGPGSARPARLRTSSAVPPRAPDPHSTPRARGRARRQRERRHLRRRDPLR